MARPVFKPVFEETEENIKNRVLSNPALEGWRKEPGDFMHDAVVTNPPEVQMLEINQDTILKNAFALYAEDEWLDLKLGEVGLTRSPALPTKRKLLLTSDAGVVVPKNHKLNTLVVDANGNPIEWTVDAAVTWNASGQMEVAITSSQAGAFTNVPLGSEFILQPSIPGVRLIQDGEVIQPGVDKESNQSAWERYDFKVKNPDTGGNKNDYVRWSKDVEGVGKAKCIPRWSGKGTVKVVLIGTDYTPASDEVVADVQEYLDPGSQGLGEGKAPCGAAVTAVKATGVVIAITATVTWAEGADPEAGQTAFENTVKGYFKDLAFSNTPNVVYNKISAFLTFTEGVSSFTGLTVNGGAVDIAIGTEAVAVLEAVTL